MELLKENIRPLDILTPQAFENALRADMAIGCSSNTVLHVTAISHAAGCPINLRQIDDIGRETPQICKLNPASQVFITDLNEVGGIQSMLKELDKGGLIHRDLLTVNGTVGERIDAAVRRMERLSVTWTILSVRTAVSPFCLATWPRTAP